ncbi:MAG: glycosyltransferase family 2 protein [Geobacter sp.]|jgi:glycosyltransferase involved in cell wall biosynthesis|nr:glycosyltransferase family 2 protein [Geobacter sp.]
MKSCVPRRKLSAVIIAKNEAERIEDCLRSVSWADEIVVVDSGSTDATCTIARRYTDRVQMLPWLGFGPQKQAAVDLASHDWILSIDCDERVTPELAEEILVILTVDKPMSAYTVPRRTFIGNKEIKYCGWYPDRTVRLFDRTKARFSESIVHEVVVVNGRQSDCRNDLLHFSFASINDMLPKMQRYSELAARQMFSQGRRCRVFDLTVRPLAAFFKTYLLKAGLLDGVEGLAISVTTAVLAFLKYVRLREMQLEKNIEINS